MLDKRLIDMNTLPNYKLRITARLGEFEMPGDLRIVFWEDIEKAPTIDAVEVVRCRNCRLWRRTEKHYGKCPFLIGEHQYTSEDGFCNLGEKMDENKKED
jgi:hypothetical protein